jgi:hypothetical protein
MASRALRVSRTGESGRADDFQVSARQLGEDRFLVVSNTVLAGALSGGRLAALSRAAPLTFVELVETVTASRVEGWTSGARAWSVRHDNDESTTHLKMAGSVPENFEALRQAALAKQTQADAESEGVDYVFDLPLDFATSLNGVTYEDDIAGEAQSGFEQWDLGPVRRRFYRHIGFQIVAFILGLYAILYVVGVLKRWLWAQAGWN